MALSNSMSIVVNMQRAKLEIHPQNKRDNKRSHLPQKESENKKVYICLTLKSESKSALPLKDILLLGIDRSSELILMMS